MLESIPIPDTMTPPGRLLSEVIRSRRSCRAYDPTRDVPSAWVHHCLDAARQAPSACNRQPWRFVVVRSPDTRAALIEHALLPGIQHGWLADAPVVVALCAVRDWVTHRVAPLVSGVPYWLLDVGIAGEHFVLAATELGLGTCWIGWVRRGAVRRILGMPRSVHPVSLIAVGFPKQASLESPPRPRKDLGEIAFSEQWGTPFAAGEGAQASCRTE